MNNKMAIREMDLHITNECNLRCRHCVFSSGSRILQELDFKEVCLLVREFSFLTDHRGIINIFGGEVLLRNDIFDIIRKIQKEKLCVGITTNCHVSLGLIEKLLEQKINRLTSDLDGATAEVHDWLRNKKGNFHRVIETLKGSVQKEIFTTVNSVLHKGNIGQVLQILDLCQYIGVDSLSFYFMTPTGRGIKNEDIILEPNKWITTKKIVIDWIKRNAPKFSIFWEEAYELIGNSLSTPRRCEKEHNETIFIRCDGEVYSCALLEATPCSIGNVKKEKLNTLLNKRISKAFKNLQGCPAIAFYKYGDVFEHDPRIKSQTIKLGCPYNCVLLTPKQLNKKSN